MDLFQQPTPLPLEVCRQVSQSVLPTSTPLTALPCSPFRLSLGQFDPQRLALLLQRFLLLVISLPGRDQLGARGWRR